MATPFRTFQNVFARGLGKLLYGNLYRDARPTNFPDGNADGDYGSVAGDTDPWPGALKDPIRPETTRISHVGKHIEENRTWIEHLDMGQDEYGLNTLLASHAYDYGDLAEFLGLGWSASTRRWDMQGWDLDG